MGGLRRGMNLTGGEEPDLIFIQPDISRLEKLLNWRERTGKPDLLPLRSLFKQAHFVSLQYIPSYQPVKARTPTMANVRATYVVWLDSKGCADTMKVFYRPRVNVLVSFAPV